MGPAPEARDYYDRHSHRVSKAQRKLAWEELLIAEGSDWNWWYGPEHHSANDKDFDELYRRHLSNVYYALEGAPPEELSVPIMSGVTRPSYSPQTAYVRVKVDGKISNYFEWMGQPATRRTSAPVRCMASSFCSTPCMPEWMRRRFADASTSTAEFPKATTALL